MGEASSVDSLDPSKNACLSLLGALTESTHVSIRTDELENTLGNLPRSPLSEDKKKSIVPSINLARRCSDRGEIGSVKC